MTGPEQVGGRPAPGVGAGPADGPDPGRRAASQTQTPGRVSVGARAEHVKPYLISPSRPAGP